jgi:hypothetical protein
VTRRGSRPPYPSGKEDRPYLMASWFWLVNTLYS